MHSSLGPILAQDKVFYWGNPKSFPARRGVRTHYARSDSGMGSSTESSGARQRKPSENSTPTTYFEPTRRQCRTVPSPSSLCLSECSFTRVTSWAGSGSSNAIPSSEMLSTRAWWTTFNSPLRLSHETRNVAPSTAYLRQRRRSLRLRALQLGVAFAVDMGEPAIL